MQRSDKKDWEGYALSHPRANFLQSWAWGEFHRALGNNIHRISFEDGQFLAVVENARRGRYLTIPGGPLLGRWSRKTFGRAVYLMKELAESERCIFIRMRPQIEDNDKNRRLAAQSEFRLAPMHLHAELTRALDLSKSDDELLTEMRKNTRYSVKRAQKLGIEVHQTTNEKYIDDLYQLQLHTAKRHRFVPFSRKYLLEQFRAFKKNKMAKLFFVEDLKRSNLIRLDLKRVISIAFVIFYHGEAVYHYSASSEAARKIPAAYAIQWAVIQEAKKRGCTSYNLWGDVADNQLKTHRFAGPSLFKRGFGGRQISYLHAHDLPLSWKYWIDWSVESMRKKSRKL